MTTIAEKLAQAVQHHRDGAWERAASMYREILESDPEQADALNLLGVLELQARNFAAATGYLQRAVSCAPCAEYHNNLGLAWRHRGDADTARAQFETALRLQAGHIDAAVNLATLWREGGRTGEARALLEGLIDTASSHPAFWYNLALVELDAREYSRARQALERALALDPADADARFNLAVLHKNDGEPERAATLFDGLVEHPRHGAKSRWYLSQCRLLQGDHERGWQHFAERFEALGINYRATQLPSWGGEPLADGALLICAEQGIGDELLFATHLPLVENRTRNPVFECDRRLVDLFQRSYPEVRCIARGADPGRAPTHHCAAGDLVRLTNPDLSDPGAGSRPLVVDAARAADLVHVRIDCPVIGLSYHTAGSNAVRRMPPPEFWCLLRDFSDGVILIDLQADPDRSIGPPPPLRDGGLLHTVEGLDLYDDLDGLAALIAGLDHVITIDNSIVHLAGSLAVPTTLLLSTTHDWRWLTGSSSVPWYPTVDIIRQDSRDDWDSVADALRQRLLRITATGECPRMP